jgi:ribonucleotide reductase beta subunit family protein with ferritin-like domain
MQNQKELSVIFLSFKSSHQVHDKQLHHLSKLLDQYFLWVNIHIAMMNKNKQKKIEIFCFKCLVFNENMKESLIFEKMFALFYYLEKCVSTLLLFGKNNFGQFS